MPDCLGKNDLSARKIIRDELRDLYGKDMDSVIEIIEKYDSSAAKGTVIASSPAAGMTIDSYNIPAKITLYISNGPEPTELMMPDVVFRLDESGNPVRCTKDEAVKLLEEAEIKPEVKGEFNNTVEAGRIIRTEPAANTMFMSDDVVTVYYSNGKDPNAMYDMIDCSGMTEEAAKKKFVEDFGHAASSVKIEYEYSETVEKGKVIRTNPATGKHVYADRDTVTVYVSKGNPSKMPDVLYFDLEEAKRRLKKAGISSGNVRVEFGDSFEDDGTVYDCNITVGAPVDEDAEVILYVSNGTKPSYDDLLGEAGYGD
jgi:beta-lactam-binding protein with PASTA domain